MNKKNLLAILVGFVVSIILGFLVYGVLLKDYMAAGTMAGINKPMEEMMWWAMILANLSGIILFTYVLNLAGANNFMTGAKTAFWVALLMALSYDLYFWGGTNMYTKMDMVFVDAIVTAVMGAIIGGVIGWMLGMGNKPAAATA